MGLICGCSLAGTAACRRCSAYIEYLGEYENSAHIYPTITITPKSGWQCPKCGRVWSPDVICCPVCTNEVTRRENE